MPHVSQLLPGEVVITDRNWKQFAPAKDVTIDGEKKTRGLIPRDESLHPRGATPFMQRFDLPIIPRSEWPDRIEAMEKTKTRISDICYQVGLKCKDQNGTSYCWINAPTYCIEVVRAIAGLPTIYLSPASVGAKIKNFRNVGGWGSQGLEYIVEHGSVPVDLWPANAIKREHDTPEAWQRAKDFQVIEWYDAPDRNFDAAMTCLFHRIPVAVGYNWWSHEVTLCDPVNLGGGEFGVRFRNSWGMNYGTDGYNVLNERKGTPDDAVAPRVAIPAAA